MFNFKLIGTQLGEGLKLLRSYNEINRAALAVFEFEVESHPNGSITSSKSQLVFDWVMTLADQQIDEARKIILLEDFVAVLTPDNSPLRNIVKLSAPRNSASFWQLIHPSIERIAKRKYDDGHFADAVESAFKDVNSRVKAYVKGKTGEELDGASLMTTAFSVKNPIIMLGDLTTESGDNMQKGYMQIFAGAMTGIRNPKAHENIIIDDQRAIHFLFLASLLMSKLDEAGT